MLEEVVIVFFVLCHINCLEILTTIMYLFHIKTWNFLYKKSSRFFTLFFYRNKHRKTLFSNDTKTIRYPLPQVLVVKKTSFWLHNITKNNSPIPFLAQTNCRTRNQTTTNQTTSIKLTRNCSKEHISHSYYPTPIKLPSNTSQFVP